MAVGVARGSQTWADGLFCSILAVGDPRLGKLGRSMLIPSCGSVWMGCVDGMASGLCQGGGKHGHARCGRRGALKRVRGPRHTSKNLWGVSKLSPFPAARLIGSTSSFPLVVVPSSPLINHCFATAKTLQGPIRNIRHDLTHAARNDSWPAPIMPIARVCSPPREQPQAGLEEFRRAPLDPSSTDHTTGPTQAPARLCLSRRIRLTLGRKLGTEIPNCHQGHQRRSTKRTTQPHFIHFTYNLEFGSSSPWRT